MYVYVYACVYMSLSLSVAAAPPIAYQLSLSHTHTHTHTHKEKAVHGNIELFVNSSQDASLQRLVTPHKSSSRPFSADVASRVRDDEPGRRHQRPQPVPAHAVPDEERQRARRRPRERLPVAVRHRELVPRAAGGGVHRAGSALGVRGQPAVRHGQHPQHADFAQPQSGADPAREHPAHDGEAAAGAGGGVHVVRVRQADAVHVWRRRALPAARQEHGALRLLRARRERAGAGGDPEDRVVLDRQARLVLHRAGGARPADPPGLGGVPRRGGALSAEHLGVGERAAGVGRRVRAGLGPHSRVAGPDLPAGQTDLPDDRVRVGRLECGLQLGHVHDANPGRDRGGGGAVAAGKYIIHNTGKYIMAAVGVLLIMIVLILVLVLVGFAPVQDVCISGDYFGQRVNTTKAHSDACVPCPLGQSSEGGQKSKCFCTSGYYSPFAFSPHTPAAPISPDKCEECERGLWAPSQVSRGRTSCQRYADFWRLGAFGANCLETCSSFNMSFDSAGLRLWEQRFSMPDVLNMISYQIKVNCSSIALSYRNAGPFICAHPDCGAIFGTCYTPAYPLKADDSWLTPKITRRFCPCFDPSSLST
mmetsp:Transcript_98709/g.159112  ORF Transcript_98709/g.159112 Transcript_98709/m.159112 type:complete len:590 (+) Transcript_98709:101-1870(+)